MKIAKFTKLVKKAGYCSVIDTEEGLYLSVGGAVYKGKGIPEIETVEQIRVILDIDKKSAEKISFKKRICESIESLYGLDLSDGIERSVGTKPYEIAAMLSGLELKALVTDDGELLFYNWDYLGPLMDHIKESEYVQLAVRRKKDGDPYILVIDGFETIGAIMPVKLLTDEYMKKLKEFEVLCMKQKELEGRRDALKKELAADPEADPAADHEEGDKDE